MRGMVEVMYRKVFPAHVGAMGPAWSRPLKSKVETVVHEQWRNPSGLAGR